MTTCEYIKQDITVLVTGPDEIGKSFIVFALGYQAYFASKPQIKYTL